MLSNLLNNTINFFSKKAWLFLFILLGFLSVFTLGILKININESIFSMLPKENSFSNFSKLIDESELTNQVIFSLNINGIDEEQINNLVVQITDSINNSTNNLLKDIVVERPNIESEVFDYFYNNFPLFIEDNYYDEISNKIKKDSVNYNLSSAQRNLLSPGGFVFRDFILKDPVSITGNFFKNLNENKNESNLNIENGYVYSKNKNQILITAKTTFNSSDNKKNIVLYHQLNRLKENWNKLNPTNQFNYFGTFQIGAENGIQVKKDTFLTLIITLVVILLILFIFYRKILIPIYFMLPLIFGAMFALGVMGFFKAEISGISIATGAVVFGIILDYSFHFFTHLKHTKSISNTVKEITSPLLTGGFTTIMAFLALLFTNSTILQDFGLFASLSLTGAALFTLTGLPIILKIFRFKYSDKNTRNFTLNISISDKYRKIFVLIVLILTATFLYFSPKVQFDGELDNLSYHSNDLKERENSLLGINPEKEKKLYLFSEGSDFESASQSSYNLYKKIKELESLQKIKSSFSVSKFIVPEEIALSKYKVWELYWNKHRDEFLSHFNKTSDSLGFNKGAFVDFKNWISTTSVKKEDNSEFYASLGLTDFINDNEGKTTIISTVVVKKEVLNLVQNELEKIDGVSIFNRTQVAEELLTSVKDDFNYILLVSSLLVFISLLIIYGRIEMALFTFIPMVISWVWILGIAGIFGLKFNFVNIVIATFIFGLGDDFSIFVTDGLLHKYKTRKNTLGSYNLAIILSALTTMVGTGVLFFAKHPAIHSVSVLSVLGILCVLLISIVIQPFLFDLFVQKRIENKKTPLSLIAFIFSVFEFSWFVFGCVLSYGILIILFILPIPKKYKRRILNNVLSISTWSVMYSALHVRKKVLSRENLDVNNPSIIITNHTSFLDILATLMIHPKILIVVKDWVYNSILFGPVVRYAGFIYIGDGPEENLKMVKDRINDGYSILIFPEGSRSKDDKIRRFHKGAFYLARELNLDITPLLIYGNSYVLPKTEYFVKHGIISLKFLPRIKHNDYSWGETFGQRTKSISKFFKAEYSKFKDEQETGKVLFNRIFANYIYKGPKLEWYLKIKWKLECKNYERYNLLLQSSNKILDLGCGYGYLSLFLHYKNEDKEILGVDYDSEKIEIASNCFDKSENLSFECADIVNYEFEGFNAIILNDVLHYFSEEKQISLLKRCVSSLPTNGVILIRDGVTDFQKRHEKTIRTELFSTRILGFNKKEEEFHFFSSEYIRNFAKQHHLEVTMEEQSNKTSNVLFILKKQ